MQFFSWRHRLRRLPGTAHRSPYSRLPKSPRLRKSCRLEMERLETRLAPATHTWTGAALDGNWKTAANWQSNFVPTGGLDMVDGHYADLVFRAPAPLAQRATHNNPTTSRPPLT